MNFQQVMEKLETLGNPEDAAGKARFGIKGRVLGVRIPALIAVAKEVGKKDHALALELWETGVQEARILAAMVDDPDQVTSVQMDAWASDFDSWDVCDQCCMRLFRKTPCAWEKVREWTEMDSEFVRRAGFALLATLSVHEKQLPDEQLLAFFPVIEKQATDGRVYVKKAVNWALRQIGKSRESLWGPALDLSEKLAASSNPHARWVGADAARELAQKGKERNWGGPGK